ncbi:hypothetical protein Tco_1562354 [Tanacetum coccineum]
MAQQVIPAAQLVPRFYTIGRCNNYAMLQSIPCSPECKIVGKILLDHPLSYALTATADVITVYLQQFWRTVSKVPMETPKNPIVTPVNIEAIKAFMNRVGYQGVVDKVSTFYTKKLAQPWQTMFKVFNRCLTTRTSGHDQTKINILQMFHAVINRTNVDYDALLCCSNESTATGCFYPGTHRSTPRAHRTPILTASHQGKKRKQIVGESSSPQKSLKITIRQQKVDKGEKDDDDFADKLEPGSHKDNPEHVDDDDDKDKEKELTDTVPLLTTTTSNTPHSKRRISSKYSHLPGVLRRMCRRQGYMIQLMEQKCVTTKQIWKTHKQVNQALHEGVSQLSEKATKDLIENNLKPCIAATIIEDLDAFRSKVPDLVSQEFNAQTPKIIEDLFKNYIQINVIQVHPTITTSTETTSSADLQQQLYFKMKRSPQDQAVDPEIWEILKAKLFNSSYSLLTLDATKLEGNPQAAVFGLGIDHDLKGLLGRKASFQSLLTVRYTHLAACQSCTLYWRFVRDVHCSGGLSFLTAVCPIRQRFLKTISRSDLGNKPLPISFLGSGLVIVLHSGLPNSSSSSLTDFESWQQRIRLYYKGKDHGEYILQSIDEGPFKMGRCRDEIATGTDGPYLGLERDRVVADLSQAEKDRLRASIRAMNILLQGLPRDIYKLINHNKDAKDIWDNVKMFLEASELTKDDCES